MAAVAVCIWSLRKWNLTLVPLFPPLFAMKWWDRIPRSSLFWMLNFKPAFSFSSFTFCFMHISPFGHPSCRRCSYCWYLHIFQRNWGTISAIIGKVSRQVSSEPGGLLQSLQGSFLPHQGAVWSGQAALNYSACEPQQDAESCLPQGYHTQCSRGLPARRVSGKDHEGDPGPLPKGAAGPCH